MRLNFNWGPQCQLLAVIASPAQAAIAYEGTGEVATDVPQTIPETIQETRPEPDHSQGYQPIPPRTTTTDQIPLVFEQGHTSDPNIASFSGAHESDPDLSLPQDSFSAQQLFIKKWWVHWFKKDKSLELKLNTRSRKVVMSESDTEEEEEQDVDPLIKLAKAAAASDAHVNVSPGADMSHSPPHPTSDVPTIEVSYQKSTLLVLLLVYYNLKLIHHLSEMQEWEKVVAVKEAYSNLEKTFMKWKEERLDANFARQMSQDFEMTKDQRKRQQEVLAFAANYSCIWRTSIWLVFKQIQTYLPQFLGLNFLMMILQPGWLSWQYLRTYVKNQGPAVYSTGWTMVQVRKLSPEQLQEEFDKIQRAIAFTRAPSHGVPQEEESTTPSLNVSREEVAAPPYS
ncbi:hypothetical protein Tco_0546830 [Tanacetum coccineum]